MCLTYTKYILFLLFLGSFFITGCGLQPPKGTVTTEKTVKDTLQAQLDEGRRLFRAGDFSAAEEIFSNLQNTGIQTNGRPHMARQVLYGLACTRLMLAENRAEYLEAVRLLDKWRRISPVSLEPEDPRMLLSFFPETIFQSNEDNANSSESEMSVEEPFLMLIYDYEKEIDTLQDRIRSMENQLKRIDSQEAAMKTMAAELEKLRDQIETMETIDQEIQEKKQGITSP